MQFCRRFYKYEISSTAGCRFVRLKISYTFPILRDFLTPTLHTRIFRFYVDMHLPLSLSLSLSLWLVIDSRTPSSIRNSFSSCMEFSWLENSISSLSYIFIWYKDVPVSDKIFQRSQCFLSLASNQDLSFYGFFSFENPLCVTGLRGIRQIDSVCTVDHDRVRCRCSSTEFLTRF